MEEVLVVITSPSKKNKTKNGLFTTQTVAHTPADLSNSGVKGRHDRPPAHLTIHLCSRRRKTTIRDPHLL